MERNVADGNVSETSVAMVVVETIAEQEGVDSIELEPPLYESIDPDALNHLFRDGSGTVYFEYLGYGITVDSDWNVDVSSSASTG